jgi:amidase
VLDPARPDEAFANAAMSMAGFTIAYNVSGQPAMSVPLHWNEGGLPIGVMFVGGWGREDVLFQLAAQLEQAQPWRDRWPTLAGVDVSRGSAP